MPSTLYLSYNETHATQSHSFVVPSTQEINAFKTLVNFLAVVTVSIIALLVYSISQMTRNSTHMITLAPVGFLTVPTRGGVLRKKSAQHGWVTAPCNWHTCARCFTQLYLCLNQSERRVFPHYAVHKIHPLRSINMLFLCYPIT